RITATIQSMEVRSFVSAGRTTSGYPSSGSLSNYAFEPDGHNGTAGVRTLTGDLRMGPQSRRGDGARAARRVRLGRGHGAGAALVRCSRRRDGVRDAPALPRP